jgi:RNA polymerase sigma-70 factor (ECF subfamily)
MTAAAPPPDLSALLRHADWVHRLARRLCADEHAAADAVQETWATALRRPPRHGGNLRAWLARLLGNCAGMAARSDRRRRAREGARAPESFAEAAAETVARADLHRHLAALVLELPEPQRTLVLLHYFEGEDQAALARRFSLTADAVRAHLRRARATLRERLQRGEPPVQRAFAALLATHAIPALTMTIATKTMAAAGALAAAALLYALWPAPPPGAPAPPVGGNAGLAPAAASAADTAASARTVDPDARERSDVTPPAGRAWTVRLDGLRPEAPWTAKVHVDAEGRDEQRDEWLRADAVAEFARGDTASVPRPAWLDRADRLKVRLRADDPNYRPLDLDLRNDDEGLRARDGFVVPVQVVGVLTGRVVDFHGAPVAAARVCAFANDGSAQLGQANTAADGRYVLQAPPSTSLLVTATPMSEASLSGKRMTGKNGAVPDDGTLRQDLLPASVAATARSGAETRLDDLVLCEPSLISGRVTFTDGTPVAKVRVMALPEGVRGFQIDAEIGLKVLDDGSLTPVGPTESGTDGSFILAARPGARVAVAVGFHPEFAVVGSAQVRATAPARVTIELPMPICVCARRGGQPCTDARFEVSDSVAPSTGTVRVILNRAAATVRARAGTARSPSVELRREQAGSTIDLELAEALVPVAIDFRGDGKVRQGRFDFVPVHGGERLTEVQHRDDRGEPFRFFVAPGRYRLDVRAARGEHGSTFLRPQSLELEVGATGGTWTLPMSFGGRISIAVTDPDGRFVGGRCTVRDRDGHDRTGEWIVWDGPHSSSGPPGVLLPAGASESRDLLDPGDYDLELDLGAHGIERHPITVRAGEVTEVAIRVR